MDPRSSAKFINQCSKWVTICDKGINNVSQKIFESLHNDKFSLAHWKSHPLHPKSISSATIDWIFVIDALNFSFWPDDDKKYQINYKGQGYTGYWSLCAAINRALDQKIPITDPKYYERIGRDELEVIFKAESLNSVNLSKTLTIPLIDERVQILQKCGNILNQKFKGSFVNCVKECENSAKKLLQIILENFECFRDKAWFHGQQVSFHKRAQILIADIYACFENKGLGHFIDIEYLTMFADYRVPQVLYYFDVLHYSDSLKSRIENKELIENGDKAEIEIRGQSIYAIELIKQRIEQLSEERKVQFSNPINSIVIDFYLWDYRHQSKEITQQVDECIPFHRTRSIFY